MQFNVIFYTDPAGVKPLVGFLEEIRARQPVLHRQIIQAIKRIESSDVHGPPLTELVDPAHDIYELRVGRTDIARVFFFLQPGRRLVLTNAYVKKAQKLDPRELERARRYKADWESR